ncbi:hypothetical protein D3C81_1542160 [compost metagenome]
MHKLHIWKLIRYVQRVIHISEACGKYDVVRLSQLSDNPFCISAFRNIFYSIRFDPKLFLHIKTALIMLVRITAVTRRSDIDKSNRRLLCCRLCCCRRLCCSSRI